MASRPGATALELDGVGSFVDPAAMARRIWDVSEPLSPATAVFPGDTSFGQDWVLRIADGGSCNVSTIRMSVHCGTHTDAPLHFAAEGAAIADVPLDAYLGRCRVVELAGVGSPRRIPADRLTAALLDGVERILFKTCGAAHDHRHFDPDFTALGPEAAEALVASGIRSSGSTRRAWITPPRRT